MRVPVTLRVAALVAMTTLFYMYIGQLVPQKEVPAPEVVEVRADASPAELAALGEEIARGKGLCLTCHTGVRAPQLDGIATRAGERVAGLSALEYMAQSLYEPGAYLVEGFADTQMPTINEPPILLTDDEIRAVIAWLQSQGGVPTLTMETPISYQATAGPEG